MRSSLERQRKSALQPVETKEGWEFVKAPVLIKSNRYGIRISFDPDLAFENLLSITVEKFKTSSVFFAHARLIVQFEGRTFTKEEERRMASAIEEAAEIEILCLLEENTPAEWFHKRIMEEACCQFPEWDGQFYRGTLRRKQILESEKSIVIIGDVEAGAAVVSKGSVVVTGTVYGSVTAGASGDRGAVIAARSMRPQRLRIGDREVKPVIGGSYSWAKLL